MYPVINDLALLFYNLFGNGVILVIVILGLLIVWMLTVRAPAGVILVAILPVIIGVVLSKKSTNMAYMPGWLVIPFIIMIATVFAFLFIRAVRG